MLHNLNRNSKGVFTFLSGEKCIIHTLFLTYLCKSRKIWEYKNSIYSDFFRE